MKTSKTGYLRNSPDVNKPQNIIQGGDITMKGVEFKVLGTDDRGYTKIMYPGYDYKFPSAKHVTETPIKKTNMESFKQKRANLLNDNPIASHGSWISKHSIAAGSPVHMGGSGKSPLYQNDLREGDYEVTKSTTGLGGESIATERQAIIAGTPGRTYEEAGVDPAEAQAYWDANPEKYEEYKAGQKDRTVTQTRTVDVEQPKLRKNIFRGYRGDIPDEIKQADSLSYADQVGIAKSLKMPPGVFKKQYEKVTGRTLKYNPKTKITRSSGSQDVGDWTTVD
jgi:hypothetical protein